MDNDNDKKIYKLTVEYDPKTEEIEYISEEIIDNQDLETYIYGEIDLESLDFEVEMLEYIRDHYSSGEA